MGKVSTVSAFHLDESGVHHIFFYRGEIRQYLVNEHRYTTIAKIIRDAADQWTLEPHCIGAGWIARRRTDAS